MFCLSVWAVTLRSDYLSHCASGRFGPRAVLYGPNGAVSTGGPSFVRLDVACSSTRLVYGEWGDDPNEEMLKTCPPSPRPHKAHRVALLEKLSLKEPDIVQRGLKNAPLALPLPHPYSVHFLMKPLESKVQDFQGEAKARPSQRVTEACESLRVRKR